MKDPQKKENLEKAMKEAKENVAKDSGAPKGGGDAPKLKPEDVEKLAKELQAQGNGKDKQDAMKKLEEAMKDPKQRQEIEKQLDDMKKNLKDEQAKKEMDDAMKQMAKDLQQGKSPNLPKPEDIDKLAKQLQQKTDKQTQEDARKKLEDMMKDPKAREEIQKKLEDFKNNIKDDQAKKDFEQQLKNLADQLARNDKQDSPTKGIKDDAPPAIAELKHKLHAGEMTLDRFKREMTNEEFQKRSKMTPEQLAQFQKKYEEYLNRLRQDLEKMERQTFDRGSGASSLNSKEAVKLDPKSGSDPLQGGRYQAPPGFGDPYKKFTEEISGVKNPPKN
jgi:DNA repair exonuclease SbcCD ATPase subunit